MLSSDIYALYKKWPNTEFFLVRIFPHSDWIQRDTSISLYSARMQENTDQKNLRIWTLFMQWRWWLCICLPLSYCRAEENWSCIPKLQKLTGNVFFIYKINSRKCNRVMFVIFYKVSLTQSYIHSLFFVEFLLQHTDKKSSLKYFRMITWG